MKNFNLKNLMIVRNGFEDLYLVIKGATHEWLIIRDLNESEQEECGGDNIGCLEWSDFSEDLIHKETPLFSITEVYESLPIKPPFDLFVNNLFEEYKPKLLWSREPSPLSHSKLKSFKTSKEKMNYIESIVPPYIIVE